MRNAGKIALHLVALGCLTAALFSFASVAPAQVQTEAINREKIPAGTATPTGASFSVEFPVTYSDIVITPAEGSGPIRMITGVSEGHITFSASQFDLTPGHALQPLNDFMNHMRDKVGAEPTQVAHDHNPDAETLSFALIGFNGGGSLYKVIRTPGAQYVLAIQFRPTQRDDALSFSHPFFGSFKLLGK